MKENKGFSLLECIIVVVIMGIISGGIGLSVSVIFNRNVTKSADLLQSSMKKAMVSAMTKVNVDGVTIKNENGNYLIEIEEDEWIQIATSPVVLSYTLEEVVEGKEIEYVELQENESIKIPIEKGAGTFRSVVVDGKQQFYRGIRLSNGRREQIIALIPETGSIILVE